MNARHLALAALIALAACQNTPEEPAADVAAVPTRPMDIHSYAQPQRVRVTHVSLELALDFDLRRAEGSVRLDLERTDPKAPLVLDTQDLEVRAVRGADGKPRPFTLGSADARLGAPLTIELQPEDRDLTVAYATTEGCKAMQWLAPEQTAGGKHPFLFTQGQATLTRTWIPLQDSPGVRVTYDASIRPPRALTAVMSAEQQGMQADGTYRFRMPQAIPPYLIALAVGRIEFRPISPRCGVWAETTVVDGAREELLDTEAMIAAAERQFGPYRWGRYDILVLPPAFPYGGMENPRLTFATPTILAGDRSLVALVAHELAHSWSGNLVTNATWSDFWLNEGFTVYLEGRIMEAVFGRERALMEMQLERAELEEEMAGMEARDQVLHVDLAGRHPDDTFSGVPYQKGALFLRRLENVYGRAGFDRFLNNYFNTHAFQSITTQQFENFLHKELIQRTPSLAKQVDVTQWLYAPGLPADAPRVQSKLLADVEREVMAWVGGKPANALATKGWVTQQWLHFLRMLPDGVTAEHMAQLDQAFHFTKSGNSEILSQWLQLSIQHGYAAADPALESFLLHVGRRKFLKPLYTELMKTDAGANKAREIYARARPRYHAVATGTLDDVVRWSTQPTEAGSPAQ